MKQLDDRSKNQCNFSIRDRLSLSFSCILSSVLYKSLCASCRVAIRNEDNWNISLSFTGRTIVAFWHETLGLAAWHFRNSGFYTLTSHSFDGELAARIVRRFGLLALRGSSSQGGYEALNDMKLAFQHTEAIGFTLDGPKGPRRQAKPGAAILSSRTGHPIIPMAFCVHPCWRLRSWDRLIIPRPFARMVVAYGAPLAAPKKGSPGTIKALREEVETSLKALQEELETELQETLPEG